MKLTYRNVNGYLLPNLCVEDFPPLGKYGMLRRSYLQQHRSGTYTGMLLSGKLHSHLQEIDRQATEMVEQLTAQMSQQQKCDRAAQSNRPTSLGGHGEQHQGSRRGNRAERADLHLTAATTAQKAYPPKNKTPSTSTAPEPPLRGCALSAENTRIPAHSTSKHDIWCTKCPILRGTAPETPQQNFPKNKSAV